MSVTKDISEEAVTMWSKVVAFALKIVIALWTFLSPIKGVILAVGLFILLDTVAGVWKAKKTGEKITSKRLGFNGIIKKMLVYQMTVVTFFVLDMFIMNDIGQALLSFDFALTKIVAVILCSIELYSIDESYAEATGKGLFDRVKDLVTKYKQTKKVIKDVTSSDKEDE